ncbi:RNA-binding S4 domain-containing protein [Actibacterium pelagium]|uniref:Heat-shock protein Hsp15 n=1 Tax=Actibacterium pelagium TaxID=2029103 RepID=A0A917AED5_9RHOB|nr:RNA-binding S4 domain-containing protein [Actibacterium pelagium]GGE46908.1 heat-shock protein Hsp15 [Actibacterium pelagium]
MAETPDYIRLDKWLWQARFFKTRSLSAERVTKGKVRLNGTKTLKPGQRVRVTDVLTFPQGNEIRVVRVLSLGDRRGPASEAQQLYVDVDPASGD